MPTPSHPLRLTPKDDFLRDASRASLHSDSMSAPSFRAAASAALLEYQLRIASSEPSIAAVTAFKLRGAQEFLTILMQLGVPDAGRTAPESGGLIPPEEVSERWNNPLKQQP